MKKITMSFLLISLLAACASHKPPETKPAPAAEAPATSSTSAAQGAEAPVESHASTPASMPPVETDPLNDPNNTQLAKRSVYYPFDISAVQDNDKPTVEAHASYLAGHADRKVRLEGNCDERGSDEYNLALGQRRADGVKKMLLVGGAKAEQIETVSYGEERPKLTCHEEKCWKENRRTDLNYNAR
jgi:peptidoglycan-associated lipoprotein